MSADDVVTVTLPRAALTVVEGPPLRITQRNAERALGLPRRTFLELVRAFGRDGGDVVAVGKLRSVDTTAFVAWLGRRSAIATHTHNVPAKAASQDDVSTLAGELGLKLVSSR